MAMWNSRGYNGETETWDASKLMTSNFILQNNHYTATNTTASWIEKHELPTTSHSRNASFMITGSRITRKGKNSTGFLTAHSTS